MEEKHQRMKICSEERRSKNMISTTRPNCGGKVSSDAAFCSSWSQIEREVKNSMKWCSNCGAQLRKMKNIVRNASQAEVSGL